MPASSPAARARSEADLASRRVTSSARRSSRKSAWAIFCWRARVSRSGKVASICPSLSARKVLGVPRTFRTADPYSRLHFSDRANCCLCGCWGGVDAEAAEEAVHVGAEGFVVAVDSGPGGGHGPVAVDADAGDEGADDVVGEGEQGGDGAGGWGRDLVAA